MQLGCISSLFFYTPEFFKVTEFTEDSSVLISVINCQEVVRNQLTYFIAT